VLIFIYPLAVALLLATCVLFLKILAPLGAYLPFEHINLVTLIFLPFGVKVLVTLLMGYRAFVPLWISKTLMNYFYFEASLPMAMSIAALMSLVFMAGLAVTGYMLRRDVSQGLLVNAACASTLIRQVLFLSVFTSLLIALVQSSVSFSDMHQALPMGRLHEHGAGLPIRYLLGNLLGALAAFGILYSMKNQLSRWLNIKNG